MAFKTVPHIDSISVDEDIDNILQSNNEAKIKKDIAYICKVVSWACRFGPILCEFQVFEFAKFTC